MADNFGLKIPKLNKKLNFEVIHGDNDIELKRNKLVTNLKAGEVKVVKFLQTEL